MTDFDYVCKHEQNEKKPVILEIGRRSAVNKSLRLLSVSGCGLAEARNAIEKPTRTIFTWIVVVYSANLRLTVNPSALRIQVDP
jgi:hypothetical protein